MNKKRERELNCFFEFLKLVFSNQIGFVDDNSISQGYLPEILVIEGK